VKGGGADCKSGRKREPEAGAGAGQWEGEGRNQRLANISRLRIWRLGLDWTSYFRKLYTIPEIAFPAVLGVS
jgi:hypothetical protein